MTRGFSAIGLAGPKTDSNVGSALRLAHNYGASMLAVSGTRCNFNAATNTTKTHRHMPAFQVDDLFSVIPHAAVPVAIEITDDARSLPDYVHPERAFYIFGPEDGSIPKHILERCRDVVKIPTNECMNLAATVAVVLYDRQTKRGK